MAGLFPAPPRRVINIFSKGSADKDFPALRPPDFSSSYWNASVILSASKKFLFIHVYKTAGTSIFKALGRFDVCTPLPEIPVQFWEPYFQSAGLPAGVLKLPEHAPALQVRAAIGRAVFDSYFKFAFVRNPWDMQLSLYHYNLQNPDLPAHAEAAAARDFEDYIMRRDWPPNARGQQLHFLADDDGTVLMDFVGRFENISLDFAVVCERLGVENAELGHSNASKHRPWPEYYTREMFETVAQMVKPDAEAFGYSADPAHYGIDHKVRA